HQTTPPSKDHPHLMTAFSYQPGMVSDVSRCRRPLWTGRDEQSRRRLAVMATQTAAPGTVIGPEAHLAPVGPPVICPFLVLLSNLESVLRFWLRHRGRPGENRIGVSPRRRPVAGCWGASPPRGPRCRRPG